MIPIWVIETRLKVGALVERKRCTSSSQNDDHPYPCCDAFSDRRLTARSDWEILLLSMVSLRPPSGSNLPGMCPVRYEYVAIPILPERKVYQLTFTSVGNPANLSMMSVYIGRMTALAIPLPGMY